MAKANTSKAKTKGMHGGKDKKTKGRTSITGTSRPGEDVGPRGSKPNVPQVVRRDRKSRDGRGLPQRRIPGVALHRTEAPARPEEIGAERRPPPAG